MTLEKQIAELVTTNNALTKDIIKLTENVSSRAEELVFEQVENQFQTLRARVESFLVNKAGDLDRNSEARLKASASKIEQNFEKRMRGNLQFLENTINSSLDKLRKNLGDTTQRVDKELEEKEESIEKFKKQLQIISESIRLLEEKITALSPTTNNSN